MRVIPKLVKQKSLHQIEKLPFRFCNNRLIRSMSQLQQIRSLKSAFHSSNAWIL